MKTFTSHEANERFDALLDTVQNEPVTILKNGMPAAVVLSAADYARLGGSCEQILTLLGQMQKEATANGLTPNALESILDEH